MPSSIKSFRIISSLRSNEAYFVVSSLSSNSYINNGRSNTLFVKIVDKPLQKRVTGSLHNDF